MFVLSTQDNALFRVIATLVTVALVLYAVGAAYTKTVGAANITTLSDTLETSATSTASNHTIVFTLPSGLSAGGTTTITFPAGYDLTSIVEDDVDLEVAGVGDEDTAATPSGAVWGVSVSGQDLIIESGTDTIGAYGTVTVEIGDHADAFGTGANKIVNPAATGSLQMNISTTDGDSGKTHLVVVDEVYVTAQVDTTFEFVVNGYAAAGTDVNGTSTTGTTSANSLPFGLLTAGEIETLAQDLLVTTNAIQGFIVTAEVDHQLLSSTGADIDGFANGGYTDTPLVWGGGQALTNDIDDEDTWGHWGITSEDSDLNADEFGSNLWISATTSPRVVFSHNGPSDGSTPDKGSTTVGFQVEITSLQEAADDYEAILTYIATPTF